MMPHNGKGKKMCGNRWQKIGKMLIIVETESNEHIQVLCNNCFLYVFEILYYTVFLRYYY